MNWLYNSHLKKKIYIKLIIKIIKIFDKFKTLISYKEL